MAKHDDSPSLFPEAHTAEPQGPVECLGMTFENDETRREYFLEKLREKLKDPEFRKIEGFPIGEDEDILALSDPPYYTACPNPFIEDFIKHYGKPYDSATDDYHREPFAADVREGKQDPVCMAHTYHTKVPYKAIVRYILNYTDPGDVVLDCFAGAGMTGVAAQACASLPGDLRQPVVKYQDKTGREHRGIRHAVMIDLSPFATFLSRNFNSCLDVTTFRTAANVLISDTEARWSWMYETNHPQDDRKGTIEYGLWADVVFCECGDEVYLWNPFLSSETNGFVSELLCPKCGREIKKRSSKRARKTTWDDPLNRSLTQNRQDLVLIRARFGNQLISKPPSDYDLRLLVSIHDTSIPANVPTHPMMFNSGQWGDMFRAGIHFGISHTHHFWTRRNLIVLADLFESAKRSSNRLEMMFLCTSFAVKTGSRMHNVGFKGGRINLAGQTYNTLQFPSVSAERNLFSLARGKIDDLLAVFELPKTQEAVITSTQSGTSFRYIPDDSIDYVFVDPPFGDNIIYSELSFLYESWLRIFTKQDYEAIISKKQEKHLGEYKRLMVKSFQEIFRVLKPGRWITVAFHNSKNAVWNAIQEALGMAGFIIADVRTLDKGQGTYKQMTTAGAVKQDLVISAYRPNEGLEQRFELEAGTEEGVWDFARTHLRQLPVFVSNDGQAEVIAERQNFLLFDRMVAFHVQRGVTVPLSAAEFYAGLEQRFPLRDGMYFLPNQAAEYDKKRMTVKEVLQLQLFVSDEASAIQWLKQQLTKKPQTFQDIHPQFLKEIGGWQKHEKALELSVLLGENFLRYDGKGEVPSQIHSYLSSNFKELRNLAKDNPSLKARAKDRWYVPDPNKAGDLEKLRERTLIREFEEYRESRQKRLKVFRLEAVRAGFKKAWQERDYTTIIAVAEKIPETILQEDSKLLMWYDQALTRKGGE